MNYPPQEILRLNGGNGASFFFSTASQEDWQRSLEFYRAVSRQAAGKKILLKLAYPILKFHTNLSSAETAELITCELKLSVPSQIPEHGSAMISPTRDKAVIHRHGEGYEKVATGKSFEGVVRELEVYRLLNRQPSTAFAFSTLGDSELKPGEVRFFMKYAKGCFSERIPSPESLIVPLVEFFRLTETRNSWEKQWASLGNELAEMVPEAERTGSTPVGLVHRDFKPWNVKHGVKPLFFDFESADFAGCPLEDLFNYTVDPLLRLQSPERVWETVQKQAPLQNALLEMLGLPQNMRMRYWRWYLLERTAFWRKQGQRKFAECFLILYEISSKK